MGASPVDLFSAFLVPVISSFLGASIFLFSVPTVRSNGLFSLSSDKYFLLVMTCWLPLATGGSWPWFAMVTGA